MSFIFGKDETPEGWILIRCFNINGEEMGRILYSEPTADDNDIHIQKLHTDPSYRGYHISYVLLEHLKELSVSEYRSARINVFIAPLEPNISIEKLMKVYRNSGFTVKKISQNEAWGYFKPK